MSPISREPGIMISSVVVIGTSVKAVAGNSLLLKLHQRLDVVVRLGIRTPATVVAGVRGSGKFPEVQRGDGLKTLVGRKRLG